MNVRGSMGWAGGGREGAERRNKFGAAVAFLLATGSVSGRRACVSAVVVGCMHVGVARCLHPARSTTWYALVGHCHARIVTCSSTRLIGARPHFFFLSRNNERAPLCVLFLYFS